MTTPRKMPLYVVVAITAAAPVLAQTATSRAVFDVVSIRPNKSIQSDSSISRSGGRVSFTNVSLHELISFAYNIAVDRDYGLTGPGWLKSEKFDVVATCPPETSSDTIRRMSQGFLGERFALTVHREDKNISAYALIAAKRGPKLRASNVVDPSFTFGDGRIAARGLSMAAFADRLSGPVFKLERPVIDMTGLKGIYDFELEWSSGRRK